MGKISIENTQDFVGEQIEVFKDEFEIHKHTGDYYSISLKHSHGDNNIWGGDSAWSDCYDYELVKSIFDSWDGTLYYRCGRNSSYHIEQ